MSRVFKTAHDLHDGVDFADVAEELVAESFARARAFHQPGDVDELDRRRHDLLRMGQLRELRAAVGHRHDADIWIDGAERIIGGRRFCVRVTALKSVDFPTFGKPTIPALNIGADGKARVELLQSDRIYRI